MSTVKPKPARSTAHDWAHQVVRTADGRLIVRGVDVPASGREWELLLAGKTVAPRRDPAESDPRIGSLTAIVDKRKALAVAKRAGLVQAPKPPAPRGASSQPDRSGSLPWLALY